MVLGRSRLTPQRFTVYPGIIDRDFKEEIKSMTYVKETDRQTDRQRQINAGDRTAQLLLLPYIKGKATCTG
jgi:dUTPase